MDTLEKLKSLLKINEETLPFFLNLCFKIGLFVLVVFLCVVIGKIIPALLRKLAKRFLPQKVLKIYLNLFEGTDKTLTITATLLLFYVALDFIKEYQQFYSYLKLVVDFGVTFSLAFLFSGLLRNFLRIYGVNLITKIGLEVDELLVILETVFNVLIGIFAVLAFAQSQSINLVGLLAGLGIGGIAVAFAAQSTLEQIVGTIVLYLDRPFRPGDYIRLSLSSQGIFLARVESIGLRSTKLRTLAKSTLVVVPNSKMANADIENVTKGKKIMVLLYLDFFQTLDRSEQALIEKILRETTDSVYGIDSNSTDINFFPEENEKGFRVRLSLFIFDSYDTSQQFRRQLITLINESILKELLKYKIEFTMKDQAIYVESNVPV